MTDYRMLALQMESLLENTAWEVSVLANASAMIWESLDDINWAGFYVVKNNRLLLGPFQGRVACTAIDIGKGVCGTAASNNCTQLVPDVHEFPGHIACDSASNSEIVIPLRREGIVWGVLDIDSPIKGRFTEDDRAGLEKIAEIIEKHII